MNKKILSLWTISLVAFSSLAYVSADFAWKWFGFWQKIQISEEEKTMIQSMTNEEKQVYFEEKREESIAEMKAKETVIDKLLAWTTLTDEEEIIRQEIISQREERKSQMEEMQAKKELMHEIMEKSKAWEELTDEETALLEEFKPNKNMWKWKMRWNFSSEL